MSTWAPTTVYEAAASPETGPASPLGSVAVMVKSWIPGGVSGSDHTINVNVPVSPGARMGIEVFQCVNWASSLTNATS